MNRVTTAGWVQASEFPLLPFQRSRSPARSALPGVRAGSPTDQGLAIFAGGGVGSQGSLWFGARC